MQKIRLFEAFAGVGSFKMALRNLGIPMEAVGIAEINKFSIQSYNAIHGETPNFGDISKINPKDLPDMDLFTYSFPCQDLSIAGEKKGLAKGTRSGLLWECEKIIEEKRPKYLIMENVKNLLSPSFKYDFENWLGYMQTLGYSSYYKVLNAKDYGSPQARERVFCVSVLDYGEGKPYFFPDATPLKKTMADILEDDDKVDEKYWLSQKQIDSRRNSNFNTTRSSIIAGDVAMTLTASGALKSVDTNAVRGTSNERSIRKLTPRECWRLMGFTDEDFNKARVVCSDTQLYTQAGNAIVVDVIEGIFRTLFPSLIGKEETNEQKQ